MFRLVESLQLKNGALQNVEYHNMRMNYSRLSLFKIDSDIDLKKEVPVPAEYQSGLFKCRVVYNEKIDTIEFLPYVIRQISSLKIVNSGLDYTYKYEDRSAIRDLFEKRANCDDILIVKNGLLTDASSANIILNRDGRWYTPSTPLLKGTKRHKLLDENIIFEEEISVDDLKHYSKAALINAMLDIGDVLIDIENIVR